MARHRRRAPPRIRAEGVVTQAVDTGAPSSQTALDLPERSMFWKWVWSSVRPVVGWVLAAAGAIALLVGWFGVSGEALTAKQLPYLVSAGLTGIALFIMAAVFLATDDIRRQFERLTDLERKVDDLYTLFVADIAAAQRRPEPRAATSRAAADASGGLVALPAGTSYHRSGCSLVAGKDGATPVGAEEIRARGLRACRVCEPPARVG
jgi:hypothetical protein